jgi:hypothetical protein
MKMRHIFPILLACVLIFCLSVSADAVPQLKIGVAAENMDTARLNFGIANNSDAYAGVNAKIRLPANVRVKSVSAGNLLSSSFFTSHHSPADNTVTVIAYSGTSAFSGNGILFTLELDTSSASDGTHSAEFGQSADAFVNSKCALSDPDGNSVTLTQQNGYLAIGKTDTDNDGLPDALELAVAGNSTGLSADADDDGDGDANWDEFQNMTDLTDANSFLSTLAGDLNNDQRITIADTIIALKVVAGISAPGLSAKGQKIGLEHAVYALKSLLK